MQLSVQGKQINVGEALRTHITDKLNDLNEKYLGRAVDAKVFFSREGEGFYKAHITLSVGNNIQILGDGVENEIYHAFDVACAKVTKQLRKYKNRLRNHHRKLEETPESESLKASAYILASEALDHHDDHAEPEAERDEPLIIAEMTSDISTLCVSDAVMRMDLSDQPAYLFRNAGHKGLNLVYRRADGNIGWIDPYGNAGSMKEAAE